MLGNADMDSRSIRYIVYVTKTISNRHLLVLKTAALGGPSHREDCIDKYGHGKITAA